MPLTSQNEGSQTAWDDVFVAQCDGPWRAGDRFVEVYMKIPLSVCEDRDPKAGPHCLIMLYQCTRIQCTRSRSRCARIATPRQGALMVHFGCTGGVSRGFVRGTGDSEGGWVVTSLRAVERFRAGALRTTPLTRRPDFCS